MDKLKMETPNFTDKNIEKILELFPNVATETEDENGKIKRAINFEKLKQELLEDVVDGDECYDFTWVGKKQAIIESNKPIRKTLRPCKEESLDWETTENIYIEGDNLDVLKLLQESYLNQVKMIYIDPPYNTGKDSFVYNDNFAQSLDEYEEDIALYDENGYKLFRNTETNPRFHSVWCSMIYQRLRLARNLLSDDGIIFISIDDNEVENLKNICNEIFGKSNFEGHIHWRRRHNQPNDKTKMIGLVAEHILVYAKDKQLLKQKGVGKVGLTGEFSNPDNDPKGDWGSKPWKVGSDQSGSRYIITTPTGKILDEEWMGEENTYKAYLAENRIYFPNNGNGFPRKKYYRFEREEEGQCATNWWSHELFGCNQEGNNEVEKLFGVKNIFSNPKPIKLLTQLINISNAKNNDIIMDFFAGSGSTADAVLNFNLTNKENCKFICVQLPELLSPDDNKQKIPYEFCIKNDLKTNISELTKERIRRAAKKIKEENPDKDIDTGFRVFKLDSTNMKDVYYTPAEYEQKQLNLLESNIKEDRNDMDLLYGVLLDWGVELSLSHKIEEIDGKRVHIVNNDDLIACFEKNITETVVREIAKKQPTRAVFRDGSFNKDDHKINVEEIFKLTAPNTTVKVI